MQDHEKWIKDTFSKERIPLDTNALFQEIEGHIPKSNRRYLLLWILVMFLLLGAGYFISPDMSMDLTNDRTSNMDFDENIETAALVGKNHDLNSDPAGNLQEKLDVQNNTSNTVTKSNQINLVSIPDILDDAPIEENKPSVENSSSVKEQNSNKKETQVQQSVANTYSMKQNVDLISTDYWKDTDSSLHDYSDEQPTSKQPKTEIEETQDNFTQLLLINYRTDYKKKLLLPSESGLLVTQNSLFHHPEIKLNKTKSNSFSLWMRVAMTNSNIEYNSDNSEIDGLYKAIAQSEPGIQIDLGTAVKISDRLHISTSLFYRSLVQSMSHTYTLRSSSEQEGIKQLQIDTNGNTIANDGMIEVVQLHQYTGIWYQFVNQVGINAQCVYNKPLTKRLTLITGIGASMNLLNQNTGSYISDELAITAINRNSMNWSPSLSILPSFGFGYRVSQRITSGIDIQYVNTHTKHNNQQFRYHMLNIGLTCAYKL